MSSRIDDLLPEVAEKCRLLVARAEIALVPVVVVHTYRSPEEQDRLYAKGRTIPGEPCWHNSKSRPVGTCLAHPLGGTVTRARAGFSWHNFRRAFDVALRSPLGTAMWPKPSDPRWKTVGLIGEELGLEWGGRWKVPDSGHYQDKGGLTLVAARRTLWQPEGPNA